MKNILTVRGLHASIEGKEILRGIDFTVNAGEVHAIMGPNGSGKSTFASVIAGSPRFEVTAGTAEYDGKNLLEMNIEERARAGIFLGFQYPVEIPGVSMANFMKLAVARRREYLGLPPALFGRVPETDAREGKGGGTRQQADGPCRERRLLGRRKEEERNLPDGHAGARNSPYWTRRTAGSTSTRSASWRRG